MYSEPQINVSPMPCYFSKPSLTLAQTLKEKKKKRLKNEIKDLYLICRTILYCFRYRQNFILRKYMMLTFLQIVDVQVGCERCVFLEGGDT